MLNSSPRQEHRDCVWGGGVSALQSVYDVSHPHLLFLPFFQFRLCLLWTPLKGGFPSTKSLNTGLGSSPSTWTCFPGNPVWHIPACNAHCFGFSCLMVYDWWELTWSTPTLSLRWSFHSLSQWKALKCKPTANCAWAVPLIDGLGY